VGRHAKMKNTLSSRIRVSRRDPIESRCDSQPACMISQLHLCKPPAVLNCHSGMLWQCRVHCLGSFPRGRTGTRRSATSSPRVGAKGDDMRRVRSATSGGPSDVGVVNTDVWSDSRGGRKKKRGQGRWNSRNRLAIAWRSGIAPKHRGQGRKACIRSCTLSGARRKEGMEHHWLIGVLPTGTRREHKLALEK